MATQEQKRARLASVAAAVQADIDTDETEIAAIKAIAAGSRTAVQKLQLDMDRRHKRLAVLCLLALGLTRDADVTGTDG